MSDGGNILTIERSAVFNRQQIYSPHPPLPQKEAYCSLSLQERGGVRLNSPEPERRSGRTRTINRHHRDGQNGYLTLPRVDNQCILMNASDCGYLLKGRQFAQLGYDSYYLLEDGYVSL